ncbi:putative O-glycosylation ligase, exosortase A system-associated [Halorhodospira halophila]|uniref:O-antigen polymerase n=1 Tax=Halorhodospira halophila (strain DSM 244 / SL1) TaxID=349124 RepID=A1WXB0_HALHL|nr:putative O-glycosylation ligase, exosortase A system-associated [Halorhodospira halophila]ABM62322.1 O-antigen polymerase [Halorhodospira halophila SL1]MBK1730077.1 putative O-glycosylation ligase, exosortase A system-associated [Halorhodospira halophila]
MDLRDIVFGTILISSLPLILYRPWIGPLMWYWVGFFNPHQQAWGFFAGAQVALPVAIATLAATAYTQEKRWPPMTREMWLVFLQVILFTVITFGFAWLPDDAFGLWDQRMRIILMTVITVILIYGKQRVMALLAMITLSIAYFGFKGGPYTLSTGFGGMVLGPQGTFIGGNTDIGLALVMILPLTLILARQVYHGRFELPIRIPGFETWHRLIGLALYGGFWMTLISIIGTQSRGAWVALACTWPFIFWRLRFKWALVAAVVLAVGVIGVTVPDRVAHEWQTLVEYEDDGSAQGRFHAWDVAWNIGVEHPLTGAGFGAQRIDAELWRSYSSDGDGSPLAQHSIYFQTLAENGFLGLGLFLALLGFTLLTLNRLRRDAAQHPDTLWISEWSWALAIGLIGYCVAGAFLSLAYFDLMYAFIALAIILRREFEDVRVAVRYPSPTTATAPQQTPVGEVGYRPGTPPRALYRRPPA